MNSKDASKKLLLWSKRATTDEVKAGSQPASVSEIGNNLAQAEAPPSSSRAIPDDEIVQYNLRIPYRLKRKLKVLAAEENITTAPLIERMLEVYEAHRKRGG